MKHSYDVVRINRFDNFLYFIHASSPRYFENKKGELEQYNFTTKNNLEKFQVSNTTIILGDAKEKISDLNEEVDAIFIGGTGGDTKDILELCENKLKPGGRIVIGVILIETLYSVLQTIEKLKFNSVDITQITIGKSRKTSTGTMMLARNPVTVISATKT